MRIKSQNDATGEWKTEKVTNAKGTKPGIYSLYNSVNEENTDRFNKDIIQIIEKIAASSGLDPRARYVYK